MKYLPVIQSLSIDAVLDSKVFLQDVAVDHVLIAKLKQHGTCYNSIQEINRSDPTRALPMVDTMDVSKPRT
mgnify:CR=1 FL=1